MLKFIHTWKHLALRPHSPEVTWNKALCKISSSSGTKDPIFNHTTSLKSKISMTSFHPLGKEFLFCLFIARKELLVSPLGRRYLAISLLTPKEPYEPEAHSLGLSSGSGTETEMVGRPERTVVIP